MPQAKVTKGLVHWPLVSQSQRRWMRVKKLREQMRLGRMRELPRSDLAAGVVVLLVGMLCTGRGQTHGANKDKTYLFVC